jgi:hypothetical protein
MKTRRLATLCVLLGALIVSGVSASADEKPSKLTSLQTSLSNTTISGYVDSTTGEQVQPPAQLEHGGWWRTFLLWFGFHAR